MSRLSGSLLMNQQRLEQQQRVLNFDPIARVDRQSAELAPPTQAPPSRRSHGRDLLLVHGRVVVGVLVDAPAQTTTATSHFLFEAAASCFRTPLPVDPLT